MDVQSITKPNNLSPDSQKQIFNIIRYWRNSLADADKIGLSPTALKKGEQFTLDVFKSAQLPPKQIEHFFLDAERQLKLRKKKWNKNKKDEVLENEVRIEKLPVIISPYTVTKNYEHGKKIGLDKSPSEVFPLWLTAILTREGRLIPDEENTYPWIERRCLTPNEQNYTYPILGDVNDVDNFYAQNLTILSEKNQPTWQEHFAFALKLFKTILNIDNQNKFSEQDYTCKEIGYILPFNNSQGSSREIIKLYDQVLKHEFEKLPKILCDICSLNKHQYSNDKTHTEVFLASALHLGQMQNKYPLSQSQRISLSYFFDNTANDVFTIHGPPGTGKTTLLLSIIASKWVEAAIDKKPPPLIVAASTNNLAVTNILDQFNKISDDQELSKRWLPNINSFGLYLVSTAKMDNAAANNFLFRTKTKGDNNTDEFYSSEYAVLAQEQFLQNFNNYFSKNVTDLKDCQDHLHGELLKKQQLLSKAIKLSYEYNSVSTAIRERYGDYIDISTLLDKLISKRDSNIEAEKKLKESTADWFFYKSTELKWLVLFSWLPFVKNILIDKVKFYTSKNHNIFNDVLSDVIRVDMYFSSRIQELNSSRDIIIAEIKNLELINHYHAEITELQQQLNFDWDINTLFNFSDQNALLAKLDNALRYELFLLAVHYWEVTWLLEKNSFDTLSYDSKGRRKFWEIQAMLTPCFVTTLHSGPGFFQYKSPSQEFEYLTDFIDLLIIDEAGQVMSAVAGAMVGVAKKVLLVGDAKQIEPIVNLTEGIDFANTKKFGICRSPQDYNALKESGILCSADIRTGQAYGNLIFTGQRKSSFHLQGQKLPGMLLREHRRCAKKIISYCNELCYDNQLIPMTEEIDSEFPRMGYAHVKGGSYKQGSSRFNKAEAEVIADWLSRNKDKILNNCKKDCLDDCVGIVTPFVAQGNIIAAALHDKKLQISKVGTIHSLQGSEKPIIIFSPVYSAAEQSGTYFFDVAPNMLNVAVSRAQMSFLVFGDMDIFDPSRANRPSSLLAKYLFEDELNEIVDIRQPILDFIPNDEIHNIYNLESHRKALKKSFYSAKHELNIVSPYLRVAAIQEDGIIELIKNYAAIFSINIYTDPGLNINSQSFSQAKNMLEVAGANIFLVKNVHSKIITIDEQVIVVGSFNWLSAVRRLDSPYLREECSIVYTGKHVARFIQESMTPIKDKATTALTTS